MCENNHAPQILRKILMYTNFYLYNLIHNDLTTYSHCMKYAQYSLRDTFEFIL